LFFEKGCKSSVSVSESITGEAINTDAPLEEVKTTIRSLASRQSAQVEPTAAGDTTARVQLAEAEEVAPPRAYSVQESYQVVCGYARQIWR